MNLVVFWNLYKDFQEIFSLHFLRVLCLKRNRNKLKIRKEVRSLFGLFPESEYNSESNNFSAVRVQKITNKRRVGTMQKLVSLWNRLTQIRYNEKKVQKRRSLHPLLWDCRFDSIASNNYQILQKVHMYIHHHFTTSVRVIQSKQSLNFFLVLKFGSTVCIFWDVEYRKCTTLVHVWVWPHIKVPHYYRY